MAAEPTLDTFTKARIAVFAGEVAASHPAQAKTVFTLQDTLEQRLPLDVQNQIIEKLNKDPKGTLAAAKVMIDKDPKILDEVNRNPMKLATIMGVKVPEAPAIIAKPVDSKPAVAAPEAAPAPATAANAPKPSRPANAESKIEPAAVIAAKPPITDSELAMRQKLAAETAEMSKMSGFDKLEERAKKDPSLGQAVDAMIGKGSGSAGEALKSIQDIRKDPEFFNKANQAIDETPAQMRESIFAQIAANPQVGRDAMAGDQGAKSTLMMGAMMGGAGGPGKGGLAGLFGGGGIASMLSGSGAGGGLQGFGQMIGNLLPGLLKGLMEFVGKIFKGNTQFAAAPGLMIDGKGQGIMLGRYANSVDSTLGTDSSQKPVITASKPDEPAKTIGDLAKPKPENEATPVPGTPTMAQLDRKVLPGGPQNPGQAGGSFA